MKNSFKRWTVCLISVCMATAVCGTLAACGEAIPLPDYEYDYTKPAEDFGDGIKIDGKPDEALYSEGRPIETVIRGTNAEYKMMTYFGENGVYFGWEVKDDAVAYHPSRDIYGNSGVELVVGPLDKSISYEIDLNACGKRMLRKWMGSNYLNWFGELDSAVVVNGEINGVTEGYTAELYLPYHLFNADGSDTKHDTLLVNPIFIRGYQDANSDNKLWYSIGEKERGLGWGAVQDNYYHFTKGVGLEANDVTLTSGEHGTITGAKYAISGDKYVVTVNADDGYFLQQLLFAGKDVTDKLEYLGGVATYTGVVSAAGNFEIEATFAALPSEKHTLSGQVTAEGQLTNARLYAVYSGALKEIPIGADGRYSTELAAAVWTVYCSADGYLTDYEDVDLTEDASYDIHLVTDYLQPDNPNFWNFERLGKGSVYAIDSDWLTAAMHKTLNGTKVFASANLVVKHAGDDVRAGFVFQTDNGLRISVVINAQRSDHSYGIQFINTKGSDGWGEWEIADIKITDPAEIALLNSTGMPMAVLYDGGKISIWLNGVFRGENTMKEDAARKYALTSETKVTPGIIVCSKDTEFHKLTFNTTGYEEGYPITLDKSGRGNVTVEGGKTTFTPGEKVTFNVTPADGYVCTGLTVNGSDCLADLHEGKLEYQTQEGITVLNVIATFTRAENNVSGKVTADGTGIAGIEVKLTASDGTTRTELTDAEGKFRFAEPVMGGQYTLTVNGTDSEHHNSSYTSSVQSVLIDEDKDFEIALTATAQLTPEDVYILDGNKEFYTLEGFTTDGVEYMSDGKHVGNNISGGKITYTYEGAVDPNSNHEIKTALRAEANDDFWVSANFRKQDSFAMGENQRYGFVLRSDGWWIGATVIRNKGDGAMQFQFYHDWSGDGVSYWKSYTFNEADKAAWESEEGISLGVARVNKTYYLYLFRDGAWLKVFETTDYNGDGARQVDISVQIHTPNKGAELRDFTWIRGDIPVEINVTKKDHVSVSPERQDYALGDTVKLVFTPEAGMYPKSVKVDGEEKVSALTQNDEGNWVLEIENYLAKRTITVEAEFAESLVVSEATFRLTLHKLGLGEENRGNFTDGTSVTLDGLKTYQTTVQGGNAVFTMVDGGVYTLKIEGCADQTVEISNEQKEFTLTVEFNTLTTVDEAFVADEINDGKMTVKGIDGKKVVFTDTANSDEDFYYSAVISNLVLPAGSSGGDRIGFWIACDRDGNGLWDGGLWGDMCEALYTSIRLNAAGGANSVQLEWTQNPAAWEQYTFSNEQRDAMASEKGLRVGFARVAGKYYVLATDPDGKRMDTVYLYNLDNWAFNDVVDVPMQLGFFTAAGRDGAKICDFTDMQLIIVKNGQPFGDTLADKAFEVTLTQDVQGATLTTEPTPARFGNFVMKFEPEEGKLPTEFTVDGESKLEELHSDDDGNWVYEMKGCFKSSVDVHAKFEAESGETNASFKVTLHRLGQRSEIADGAQIVLKKDESSISAASVTGGVATFNSVEKGTYTLELEGYEPARVDILTEGQKEVTLEYKIIDTGSERFDTSRANDGQLSFTAGGDSKIIFTDTANSDEDFFITMVVSNLQMPIGTPDVRFGFWIACDKDDVPNGLWDSGMWEINEALYTAFRLNGSQSSAGNAGCIFVEWTQTNTWAKYQFSTEQVEKIKGSGLKIGFCRINDKYYVALGDADGEGLTLYRYDAANWAFDNVKEGKPMQIGIFTAYGENAGHTGKLADISDLRLDIVKKGSAEEKELFGVKIEKKLGEGVTLTTEPETPILCDDILLKLTATGVPSKFYVNGEDKLTALESDNGGFLFRLNGYSRDVLSVEAEFSEKSLADVNVTLDLTLHKLGLGEKNLSKFDANTNVKLVGLYTYTGNVVDGGKAGFTQVKEGKYTLQIAGCLDQEVEIKADSSEISITVEYKLVLDQGGNFETQNINDGEAKYIGTTGESHMKLDLETGTGDFFFSTDIKNDIAMLHKGTEGFRYGMTLFTNSDVWDCHITLIGNSDGSKISMAANNWNSVNQLNELSDEIKTAWEGDGITMAIARQGGAFYGLIKANGTWTPTYHFTDDNFTTLNLNVGLAGWSDITTNATFKNITFQTSIPDEVKTLVGIS